MPRATGMGLEMRKGPLLAAIGYSVLVGTAAALLGTVATTDLGLRRRVPQLPDAPAPSVTVPRVAAVRPVPTQRIDRNVIGETEAPSPAASRPAVFTSPPSSEPTTAPGLSATSAPVASAPSPEPMPSGKPRPCGLVLFHQSQCGTALGRDP